MPIVLSALIGAAWLALLLVAPVLPGAAAGVVYGLGSLICHQRPGRSFHLAGSQLPVCARCIGVYAGAFAGALASWRPMTAVRSAPRTVLVAAGVPIALTLAVEWGGVGDPGNGWRAVSGAIAGAAIAAVVLTLHYDECTRRRPIAPSPPRIPT